MTGSNRGPSDPLRRERILDAALDVIAEHGATAPATDTRARTAESPGMALK